MTILTLTAVAVALFVCAVGPASARFPATMVADRVRAYKT